MTLRTSRKQVPALFKRVDEKKYEGWTKGTINLDICGGKFFDGTKYLEDRGVLNIKYDIGLDTASVVLYLVSQVNVINSATIANGLNVIPKKSDRIKLLEFARDTIFKNGYMLSEYMFFISISIYEGNKSGVQSGDQNNMKFEEYIKEIKKVFGKEYKIVKIGSTSLAIMDKRSNMKGKVL